MSGIVRADSDSHSATSGTPQCSRRRSAATERRASRRARVCTRSGGWVPPRRRRAGYRPGHLSRSYAPPSLRRPYASVNWRPPRTRPPRRKSVRLPHLDLSLGAAARQTSYRSALPACKQLSKGALCTRRPATARPPTTTCKKPSALDDHPHSFRGRFVHSPPASGPRTQLSPEFPPSDTGATYIHTPLTACPPPAQWCADLQRWVQVQELRRSRSVTTTTSEMS